MLTETLDIQLALAFVLDHWLHYIVKRTVFFFKKRLYYPTVQLVLTDIVQEHNLFYRNTY